MKYNINKLSGSIVEIKVELGEEEIKNFVKEAEKQQANEERFKKILEGKSSASQEGGNSEFAGSLDERTLALAVSNSYVEIVEEEGLELVGAPEIKVEEYIPQKSLKYSLKVAVLPEISLGDYKALAKEIFSKELEEVKVGDKEIEDALSWLKHSRSKVEELDKPAQIGDFVEIEYDIFEPDGKKVFGKKDFFELGKGNYLAGFEENIVGLDKGAKKEFNLTIPADWGMKEWQGKEMKFLVKVNVVGKKIEPELNDDFAKSLGNFETIEDVKKSIKEGLEMEKKQAQIEKRRLAFLEKVSEGLKDLELPSVLLEAQIENDLAQIKSVAEQMGVSFEEYLKMMQKDEESLRKDLEGQAKRFILHSLILRKIAQENKVEAKEEEIQNYAQRLLLQYPPEAIKEAGWQKIYELAKERIAFAKTFELLENLSKQEEGEKEEAKESGWVENQEEK